MLWISFLIGIVAIRFAFLYFWNNFLQYYWIALLIVWKKRGDLKNLLEKKKYWLIDFSSNNFEGKNKELNKYFWLNINTKKKEEFFSLFFEKVKVFDHKGDRKEYNNKIDISLKPNVTVWKKKKEKK